MKHEAKEVGETNHTKMTRKVNHLPSLGRQIEINQSRSLIHFITPSSRTEEGRFDHAQERG